MKPISMTVKIGPSTTGGYWIELPDRTPFTLQLPDVEHVVTLLRHALGCHFHSPTDNSAVGEWSMALSIPSLSMENRKLPIIR